MPTDLPILIKKYLGILAVVGGCLFENLFGPSMIGWGLVLFGLIFEWVWPNKNFTKIPKIQTLGMLIVFALLSLWVTADFEITAPQVNSLSISIICLVALTCWFAQEEAFTLYGFGLIGLGTVLSMASPFIIEFQQNKGGFIPDSLYEQFPLILSNPVHPNIMATIMLMLFPFGLIYTLSQMEKTKDYKFWAALLGSVLMLFVLFLTRSRGGYLAAAIGIGLILILLSFRRLAVLFGGLLSIAIILLVVFDNSSTITAVDTLSNTDTFAFRLIVWELALNIIRDFPFTGAGMGTFNLVGIRLYPFPPFDDPGAHNLYLQIASDLGIPALIFYLSFVGYIIYQGWNLFVKNKNHKEMSPIFLGAWVGLVLMLLHGLIDLTVWGTRMSIMPWLIMALLSGKIMVERAHLKQQRGHL